jgi:hypothetical protein
MAGSRDVRAGGAFVEILANDSALRKGLDSASKTLKRWGDGINAVGKTFLKIGVAAMAPLLATSKVFASMGDEMAKAATRTGVSVEAISALAYAAKQSGTDLEGLENGLRKMSKVVVEAAKGSDAAVETLRLLGLTVKDLNHLSPDRQFKLFAEAISRVKDPTVRAALAMEVFGKSGTQLIPLMADGAKGIEELEQRARDLGLTWTTVDAKAAEEFGDRLDDLWQVLKRSAATIGSALVPALRAATVWVTDNVVKLKAWIDGHREVVALAIRVAGGVAAAGVGFLVLGRALSTIGSLVGGVSAALGVMASGVSLAGTVLSTVLFSGLGLAIAGLAGLAAYLAYTSEVGQRALGALGGFFGDLRDIATTALGGILDALKSGDWALAAQVLMAGLKAEWLAGIEPLREGWAAFKQWFVLGLNDFTTGALAKWEIIKNSFDNLWVESIAHAKFVWVEFTSFIKNLWEGVSSFLTDKWLELGNLVGLVSDKTLEEAKKLNGQQSQSNAGNTIEQQVADERKLIADLDKHRTDSKKALDDALLPIATAGQSANDQAKSEAAKAVDDARREAAAARARLKGLAAAAGQELLHAVQPPPIKAPPKIGDVAAGLDDVGKRTVSVAGTFNGAAVGFLGGGSIAQQQLEVQKKIERNTASGLLQFPRFR